MSDYEYVGGNTNSGFMTQDLIRTVNLSFQPYLPFTQYYSMRLQESQDPERSNYFRFGPPTPAENFKDSSIPDSMYPFSMRRQLFGGQTGKATGKITNVATGDQGREDKIMDKIPPLQQKITPLAQELSRLLNASYAFDSDSFIDENFTRESSRDAAELETRMFSEELDKQLGIGTDVQAGPMRDPSEFVYTSQTKQGFDMLLSNYRSANSYISELFGDDYDSEIEGLEVSRGAQEKRLLKIGDIKGLEESEVLTKIITKINNEISSYNKHIRNAIAPHLEKLSYAAPVELIAISQPALIAEAARESAKAGTHRGSSDYMIRQIMHRFALNSFRPYYFQGQISKDSFAIFTLVPEIDGVIPQIAQITSQTVRYVTDASTFKQGLHDYMISVEGQDKTVVNNIALKSFKRAAARSIATETTLESVGRYSMASASLNAQNEIEVTLGAEGDASVHKMSMEISDKLLKDIRSYYSTGKMQASFKAFYEKMMAAANDLTKSWYRGSSKVTGVRGKPISEEWLAMSSGWNKGDDFKKKYIGVWSSVNENSWKDGVGKNFTISPFMESRRQFSGGRASSAFTLQ